jgi:hypothetical protein
MYWNPTSTCNGTIGSIGFSMIYEIAICMQ